MLTSTAGQIKAASGMTRRELLRAGGSGALALSCPDWSRAMAAGAGSDRAVILLMLVGGPSQLETWDPKPDGPLPEAPVGDASESVIGVD